MLKDKLSLATLMAYAAIASASTVKPEVVKAALGAPKDGKRRAELQAAIKADLQPTASQVQDQLLELKRQAQLAKRAERAARSTKKRKGNK